MKAFPTYEWQEPYKQMIAVGGMDLRDYFAAKAMKAFLTELTHRQESALFIEVAETAYDMADAMMKAREQ